ncbi:MAG: phosphatidate cytidylyltransferase [Gemmatimonadaceae bacterium]|nr:phosphatidate cytidylyltransferase [Gemmatimonadaceae bacterium]
MSELTKRVLFAVAAIPVVAAAVWYGGAALATLLAIAAALAAWEYGRLAEAAGQRPMTGWLIGLAALLPLATFAVHLGLWVPPLPVVALLAPLLLTVAMWTRGVEGRPLEATAVTLFGAWYTGGMLAFAFALRYHRFAIGPLAGTLLLMLPLVITWLNDAGAFFVGKRFGRTKLMPSVSPGKTQAGAVGALLTSLVGTWAYVFFLLAPRAQLGLSWAGVLILGTALSVAAQVGDLAESLLKRQAGVKDSSHLIPGHGGVLDRVDSLLFTIPLGYVLLDVLLKVGA